MMMLVSTLHAQEAFEAHCLNCHSQLSVGFEKFFMEYLVKFSSKETVKEAMFYYLRDPKAAQSVMPKYMIKELGLMPKPNLSDSTLKEMINIYVERFDLRSKLH